MKKQTWNIKIAQDIAKKESITLTPDHWEVIYFIRKCYTEFHVIPPNRMLLKLMKNFFTIEKCNNKYLLSLFPKGIRQQANKIAGLPKSKICL
ncbi:TusE/DsrC/DsvC family sulfur relay protein [Buchnera aphidicola]|uniref:Sulfurtransferase n=1 Tax=Buchnera aphidicola (Sarucallis kahawaluokalani) TaxID=1241878 RepID=A0A4D6Y834_9GAMM|nr:TusE/DsrC/DsvC family sulfur relay protein [Buchnera aphidicola]QCI26086.1 TusE/DsrC/DsvC family sulfur relay protein [Buchnera aphidicola (Sarucallis kahawaluokalani)]